LCATGGAFSGSRHRLDGAEIRGREARARAQAEMRRIRGQYGTRFERL